MGAFEQLFGPVRGEFEQKVSKNSNARGVAWGGCWSFDLTGTLLGNMGHTIFYLHPPPTLWRTLYFTPSEKLKLLTPWEKNIKVLTHVPVRIYEQIKGANTVTPTESRSFNRGVWIKKLNGLILLCFQHLSQPYFWKWIGRHMDTCFSSLKKLSHSESSKRKELLIKSDNNVTRLAACTYISAEKITKVKWNYKKAT